MVVTSRFGSNLLRLAESARTCNCNSSYSSFSSSSSVFRKQFARKAQVFPGLRCVSVNVNQSTVHNNVVRPANSSSSSSTSTPFGSYHGYGRISHDNSIRSRLIHTSSSSCLNQQQEQGEEAAAADKTSSGGSGSSQYHNIIKDAEKPTGEAEKREFQAETKMLLDIVAKSLYSETEIFVRELISNASDALEKFRYLSLAGENLENTGRPLEIHLRTDKSKRTFTIQDTGVGMTKEEMIENLGTIAKSGSKAFLEGLVAGKGGAAGPDPNSIIGQFGVGFYSCFMVANHVDVYSRSSSPNSQGYKWTSDGSGSYEIQEAEGVQPGTKIVLQLKAEHRKFCDEPQVNEIVKKYSNFVGSPIFLDGKQMNTVEALWLKDPKQVESEMHNQFYRFLGSFDKPRFTLHFRTDVPLSLRCLLYFPEGKPGMFELSREAQIGVSLYCRKVMIKSKADNIIPSWLRFLKGVVDSEDIPLNLSRELLQDGALIMKLKTMVTNRVLRFLQDRAQKQADEYRMFYKDYGIFLKEGVITESEQVQKEEIAKLLRFESSSKTGGDLISLPEYCSRMQPAQKDIFYLAAPSRALGERSPYLEALREKNFEVLFCFEPYDEMVLLQLRQFNMKNLVSVEKEMRQMREELDMEALPLGSLSKSDAESLCLWLQQTLKGRADSVKLTSKLDTHPCVVTVEEMATARHFVRTQFAQMPPETRFMILKPRFEINVKHPLIKKLSTLKDTDTELAQLLADQLFANSMVTAGLEEDPRTIITNLTDLLTKAFEKL